METAKRTNQRTRQGILLSSALHSAVLLVCIYFFRNPVGRQIVAAGEGQGSSQGGAIEVGLVPSSEFGLSQPRAVTHLGENQNESNNTVVETRRPDANTDSEPLPSPDNKESKDNRARVTDRPTENRSDRLFSKTPLNGSSADKNVVVGRSYGSATPSLTNGVGVAAGSGGQGTGGVPGGSEYGRRIQSILSRNYNPPAVPNAGGTTYVVIELRIANDGRILSIVGGRVSPEYIRRSTPYDLVNRAAERAIIAANPLPPFPAGFLSGEREAVAEIWFRYPK
ncbi:MAG TPA: TonB C-terminal domain-containing protein [Blastocatellia bacterium]|nr:TonB C-terminal domain-containing protein [Blastocatellia bacterium]